MIALVGRFANDRFTTTWDYTTLKRCPDYASKADGFTTTWDYTTLKQQCETHHRPKVLLPLGITLLSNDPRSAYST